MRKRNILLILAALLAGSGVWAGCLAWRIHRQVVTLNVRNVPLAEVLKKIEKQTWKKICAEKGLDARITLHVINKPLRYVLDRVAEQAGARWSTVYAVYNSSAALSALQASLKSDQKSEPPGWTKLAPDFAGLDQPDPGDGPMEMALAPNTSSNGPALMHGSGPPLVVNGGPNGFAGPPNSDPPPMRPGGGMRLMLRRVGGVTIAQGMDGQTEMWSPEELVIESALNPGLGDAHDLAPTQQAAEETARKVKGKWTSYVAFRKSIMGVGFVAPQPGRPGAEPFKRNPNDRFGRLTPEQRVQQTRQRRGLNSKS